MIPTYFWSNYYYTSREAAADTCGLPLCISKLQHVYSIPFTHLFIQQSLWSCFGLSILNPQIRFWTCDCVYIRSCMLLYIAQWHNSCGWWYLRSLRMYWSFESGRGESSRLRQPAPVPLTEGYRTWYITAMGVSFFVVWKSLDGRKVLSQWLIAHEISPKNEFFYLNFRTEWAWLSLTSISIV